MLELGLLVALVVVGAIATTVINRHRPVSQVGPVGEWWEKRGVRRAVGRDAPGAREAIHRTKMRKARGGVMRRALAKALKAIKRQQRHDLKAELRMRSALKARERAERSRATEKAVIERIRAIAPATLGHHSATLAKLAALALFLGGCLLNANTYSEFEPDHQDGLTAALRATGISAAWLLGAVQMLGFTILGSAIACCLVYALAPKVALYAHDRKQTERVVNGHFSPAVYASLVAIFFLFALAVAYAAARLRLYGTLLGAASGAGAPGTSAATSLGGGGAAAAAPPTGQLSTFMILALLELIATIAVFVVLEPAVARTVRALRRQTDKDEKRAEKLGRKANASRARAAAAGLDATRHLGDAELRGWQTDLDRVELDALLAEAKGQPFMPDEEVFAKPDGVLPHGGELMPPRTTPVPFPSTDSSDGTD